MKEHDCNNNIESNMCKPYCRICNKDLETNKPNNWKEGFVEKGADIEHERWSKWQEYFFSKCKVSRIDEDDKEVVLVLPRDLYDRWWRQINTLYSELSEPEKESDRKEVRTYLPLIQQLLQSEKEEAYKQGVKDEQQRWINQTANEHDNQLKEEWKRQVIEEIKKIENGQWGTNSEYECGSSDMKKDIINLIKQLN